LRRPIQIGLRVAIAVAAYAFIAVKIGSSDIARSLDAFTDTFFTGNYLWFLVVLLLMPVVWALEAVKWRKALSPFTGISFLSSWRSVWYGVVAGQLTPNRIGEPVGRIALIDPDVRGRAAVAAIWCSLSQNAITVLFGFISIAWWVLAVKQAIFAQAIYFWLLILVVLLWVLIVLIAITNVGRISSRIERIGWVKSALKGESLRIGYQPTVSIYIIAISALRYAVFSSQYVILLKIFGTHADTINIYAAVGLTYLFSSFIPSFSASEVGIRAGFATWFVGMLGGDPVGATAASLLLWLLNLALPALIGAWFKWRKEDA